MPFLIEFAGRVSLITVFEGVAGAVLAPVLFVLVALVKLGKLIGTDKRRSARNRSSQALAQNSASTGTEAQGRTLKAAVEKDKSYVA